MADLRTCAYSYMKSDVPTACRLKAKITIKHVFIDTSCTYLQFSDRFTDLQNSMTYMKTLQLHTLLNP